MSASPRTAIFTIAARNYLHFARTLMDSVAEHAPGADRFLGLCDRADPSDPPEAGFEIIDPDVLDIPDPKAFFFQYTLLELSTAIKPYLITYLMNERGYDRVIYFDPDIRVYAPLDELFGLLDDQSMVLTPHLTGPLDDDKRPSEADILTCGAYNLGFLAVKKTEAVSRFIAWWADRLHDQCVVDIARGLFVDQKWMDLAPGLLPDVAIQRHPGWNVAYWNMPHREIVADETGVRVNQHPLVFFHFSGFDPKTDVFSKHQDRFTPHNLPPAVTKLAADYAETLRRHGYPDTQRIANAFGAFPDGTAIPEGARRIYRENKSALAARFPDPGGSDADAFITYLNQPAVLHGVSSPTVSRLAYDYYLHGPDLGLREQFPDVTGAHAAAYASWLIDDGQAFAKFPARFLDPICNVAGGGLAGATPAPTATPAKWLYKQAWRFKHLTHGLLPLAARQKIHGWMFRRAFVTESSANLAPAPARPRRGGGVNLIGYLHAELGIGEAARGLARAAAAANLPVTPRNLQTGMASRQSEQVPATTNLTTHDHDINLLVVNAEQIPYAVAELDPSFFKERYNIAVWNWELPELPEAWVESTRYLQEIWAPSAFCQEAFSLRLPLPVIRMPYAIEFEVDPRYDRRHFGLPDDAFIFLFMFDAFSIPERKNPMGLIKAFVDALPSLQRPALLVLKIINTDKDTPTLREVHAAAAAHPEIRLIESYLSRPELSGLLASADSYVSLHRSEGFGLTLAESMYLGKPVIGTGWSSTLDFMTPWNSYLVRYRLVELDRDYGPYARGQHWADPDLAHATECMIDVVNRPEEAAARGQQAARDIREQFSPAKVGQRMQARLAKLAERSTHG